MPNILHPIKMVRQGSSNTCWLACLRMLVQSQAARGRPINSTAQTLFDTRFVGRMEQHDRTLVVAQFSTVAGRFGLQSTEIAGFTRRLVGMELIDPMRIYDLLEQHGPLIHTGFLDSQTPHAIVINGYSQQVSEDPIIQLLDPLDDHGTRLPFSQLRAAFPTDGGPVLHFP